MKTLRLAILTLIIGLPLSTPCLHGQEYDWTGAGDNGNWNNPDNWDPFPDFSASNATQNQYQFIFEGPNQPHQNIGSQARFGTLHFKGGDFTLETSGMETSNQVTFGNQNGGITVDSGEIVLRSGRIAMAVFRPNSSGGLTVNNGSLLLDVAGSITLGGSDSTRYLLADGNGTLTVRATLVDVAMGGGIGLKSGFSGRLILETGGSTVGTTPGGELFHAGTGILELRADDAAGVLPIGFRNSEAAIEAGGQARTIANQIVAHSGFRVTGSHALTVAGSLDLGTGSQTIKVTEAEGNLTLRGDISSAGGTFTKAGAGKLVIEGDHAATWSQAVVISEGALHVTNATGLATGSGGLTIGTNGLLSGAGGRVGQTTIEGTLKAESPQAITFGDDLSLQSGSTIVMSHGAGAVLLEGDLGLGETVTLSLEGSGWAVGETYRLFDLSNGLITGELSFSGPYLATFSYQSGEEGYVDFQLQAIPEPSGLLLGAIAFTLAAATLRSRRNKASIQC